MAERLAPKEALQSFGEHPIEFIYNMLIRDDTADTPYTALVLGLMLGVFAIQAIIMVRFGVTEPVLVAYGLFKNLTWPTWAIAPFIHRDIAHLVVNMFFIYLAAPVELRLGKWRYFGLLFFAGYLPIYADGLKLLLFGSEPNVAVMGTSGFGFGMLGYGLAVHVGSDWLLTRRWWLIATLGGVAIIEVLRNVVFAIGDPLSLNIGHLGGLIVGLLFGYVDSKVTRAPTPE